MPSPSTNAMRIAGACLNQTPIDWTNNLKNIEGAINQAKYENVRILCLPELCITGYACEDLFLSGWVPEKALELLHSIAPQCTDIAVAIGLPFYFKENLYNTVCLIDNGKIKGFYAKQHLANDGIHYEKRWFSPWANGIIEKVKINEQEVPFGHTHFEIDGVRVGFEICEDAWHTDRPAAGLISRGVDLILNPSASHFAFGKNTTREELVKSSSKNYDCYYMYVNLLGNQSGRIIYDGDILMAKNGELILRNKRLSFQAFNLSSCKVDFFNNTHSANVEKDYTDKNEEFSRAVSLGMYDYLRKSRTKGYTLSLSGGADSSSIAVLASEMVKNGMDELGTEEFAKSLNLQPENTSVKNVISKLLTTAYQGTKNSSEETLNSAKALAESIGATFHEWKIDTIVDGNTQIIESAIDKKLNWSDHDIPLQNIQARSRSPLIWMLANLKNQILLTTSNRSEGDVGYATMDGDTSGSLAPIAGVDKVFVVEWLKYAEKTLGYAALSHVNNLKPTAELRPIEMTQTDEDDLMPYPILRAIEIEAIRNHKSPKETLDSLDGKFDIERPIISSYIKKFFRLWSINQWKRERLAPSFHLDDFNVDPKTWCRFPILSGGFQEELSKL